MLFRSLLFVALAEHHVEIRADHGIAGRVPDAAWQGAIAAFSRAVSGGRIADGVISALEACTTVLAGAFPPSPSGADRNEIPDQVIER